MKPEHISLCNAAICVDYRTIPFSSPHARQSPPTTSKPFPSQIPGASSSDVCIKGIGIPGLHEDGAGTGELTHETLTTRESGNNTTTGDTFHDVLAVPGDQMIVVNDVLFAVDQLDPMSADLQQKKMPKQPGKRRRQQLTSFLRIAPKVLTHKRP